MENMLKKCVLSTKPNKVKETVFQEKRMGDYKLAYNEQITN
jgi:hypothetical protein